MRTTWIRFALVAAVLVLLIQLVPTQRHNPPVRAELRAPEGVRELLRSSCYDCHSHHTRWPWYSRVAPVSWWLAHHVDDGRDELNLSDWPLFDAEAQLYLLGEMKEVLVKGEMPLKSYLMVHRDARLDDVERDRLLAWIDEEIALLSVF